MRDRAEAAGRRARLGDYFLARLARLVEIRRAWAAGVGGEPPGLLEHALASTYQDCVRLGLRAEARVALGFTDADAECRGSRGD